MRIWIRNIEVFLADLQICDLRNAPQIADLRAHLWDYTLLSERTPSIIPNFGRHGSQGIGKKESSANHLNSAYHRKESKPRHVQKTRFFTL